MPLAIRPNYAETYASPTPIYAAPRYAAPPATAFAAPAATMYAAPAVYELPPPVPERVQNFMSQPVNFNAEFAASSAPVANGEVYNRQDEFLQKELAQLDRVAHINPNNPAGMELQIQELAEGQRAIDRELMLVKSQINENFHDLQVLREWAARARGILSTPLPQAPQAAAPEPPKPAPAAEKPKARTAFQNMSYIPETQPDASSSMQSMRGHMTTMQGHATTLQGHATALHGQVKESTRGKKYLLC